MCGVWCMYVYGMYMWCDMVCVMCIMYTYGVCVVYIYMCVCVCGMVLACV